MLVMTVFLFVKYFKIELFPCIVHKNDRILQIVVDSNNVFVLNLGVACLENSDSEGKYNNHG